jgi:uncharacterized protein (UPF0332 family)
MTGRDFLTLARKLLAESDEADWRTAVSRAYYAAFHAAREFFVAMRFRVARSDKAHSYLWLRLQNCGDQLLKNAGSDLADLRSQRNTADYDLGSSYLQKWATDWVDTAEQIILALETATADTVRLAAVQAEVIRYERDILQDVTYQP